MDSIYISRLELWTHIGVPDEERAEQQCLWASVELYCDLAEAGKTDDIETTIAYDQVAIDIQELVKTERKTIECLAEDIAQMVVEKYKPEGGVKVTIEKKIIPETDHVSVTIFRGNS